MLKNTDPSDCPFCGLHPFEYVDVGVGIVPVAVTCCGAGIAFFQYRKTAYQIHKIQREFKREEKRYGHFMTQTEALCLT